MILDNVSLWVIKNIFLIALVILRDSVSFSQLVIIAIKFPCFILLRFMTFTLYQCFNFSYFIFIFIYFSIICSFKDPEFQLFCLYFLKFHVKWRCLNYAQNEEICRNMLVSKCMCYGVEACHEHKQHYFNLLHRRKKGIYVEC